MSTQSGYKVRLYVSSATVFNPTRSQLDQFYMFLPPAFRRNEEGTVFTGGGRGIPHLHSIILPSTSLLSGGTPVPGPTSFPRGYPGQVSMRYHPTTPPPGRQEQQRSTCYAVGVRLLRSHRRTVFFFFFSFLRHLPSSSESLFRLDFTLSPDGPTLLAWFL